LDSAPARRVRRCCGRSRAFVSGRGVGVCLDVAEAGGAIRANGSLTAGRGLTREEAARRSHAAVSIQLRDPGNPIVTTQVLSGLHHRYVRI
jgi:hypothetical protein